MEKRIRILIGNSLSLSGDPKSDRSRVGKESLPFSESGDLSLIV